MHGPAVVLLTLQIIFGQLVDSVPIVNSNLDSQKSQSTGNLVDSCIPKPLYNVEAVDDTVKRYPLMLIADQDKKSVSESDPETFVSSSLRGYLYHNNKEDRYYVEWHEYYNYTSHLNSGGRGLELSDLHVFNGKLYAADDKTSIVYRLTEKSAIPWTIEANGDGLKSSTFKTEWMTEKDGMMYVGSYGSEDTDDDGKLLNSDKMWIKVIDCLGHVQHVNWSRQYIAMRQAAGLEFPAYINHESCQWSNKHQKWFFLPRKVSADLFNVDTDQYKAGNLLITADADFTDIKVTTTGVKPNATHSFSAFQFVPDTDDTVIVALKSEEVSGKPLRTYLSIFNIDGSTVYVDDKEIPGNNKYEGLEFVNWFSQF